MTANQQQQGLHGCLHILLIEDDELLGDGIQAVLSQRGFTVDWARDGRKGRDALDANDYDIVLLDLMLPKVPGLTLLRDMRSRNDRTPVLVLTARSGVGERVQTLDNGADDYLAKPFDVEELCARIRALHRRNRGHLPSFLCIDDLMLDSDARTVMLREVPVSLSNREFDVLRLLMENRGRVLSRQHLEQTIYGWTNEVASNAVEVHIHHLRKKLGMKLIRTVRGVGYIIDRSDS